MHSEPTRCALDDPYSVYGATYEALLQARDRDALVRELRVEHRCTRIHEGCAVAQALADVERRMPKRSETQFLLTLRLLDPAAGA